MFSNKFYVKSIIKSFLIYGSNKNQTLSGEFYSILFKKLAHVSIKKIKVFRLYNINDSLSLKKHHNLVSNYRS